MKSRMNQVLLAVTVSALVFARWGSAQTIYVSRDGTNDVAGDYGTWAGAATNLHEAIARAHALVRNVTVSNGAYAVTNTLSILTNITVQSLSGPGATTIFRDPSAGNMGMLVVSNAGAIVSGFTVTNGNYGGYAGVGARLFSGTISNCVFTRNSGGTIGSYTLSISGGVLTSCTISNNTMYSGQVIISGGMMQSSVLANCSSADYGAMNMSGSAVVRRCTFRNLSVTYSSQPVIHVSGGALENCLVVNCNSTSAGAAINLAGGRMVHCTVASNATVSGTSAGVNRTGGAMTNCIVYANGDNSAAKNYSGTVSGVVAYSCSPAFTNGTMNLKVDPLFVAPASGNFRLQSTSQCLDAGSNVVGLVEDIEGSVRPQDGNMDGTSIADMGAYEGAPTLVPLTVTFSGAPLAGIGSVTSVFNAVVVGTYTNVTWWGWDFNNDGTFDLTGPGLRTVTNVFTPGRYSICLQASNDNAEVAAVTNLDYVAVVGPELYVATNGGSVFPYTNWVHAATNIHDATDNAVGGCTVYVSNGNFRTVKKITLSQGVRVFGSGPDVTTVRRDASAGNFGVFQLGHTNALVAGMTVTNGYGNSAISEAAAFTVSGGTVSNCAVTRSTGVSGGGAFWVAVTIGANGRMTFCSVTNNATYSGAISCSGVIEDSLIMGNSGTDQGGMSLNGTARRCRIIGNTAHGAYGAAGVQMAGGRLENSLVYSNAFSQSFLSYPPGVYMSGGAMVNCTVAGNVAGAGSTKGSGVQCAGGGITNCIIYGNSGSNGSNYVGSAGAVWYSCAPELTNGVQGNITNNPVFAGSSNGNYRLSRESPCLNAGTNQAWMIGAVDLDGVGRIKQGRVDMGAYELPPALGTILDLR